MREFSLEAGAIQMRFRSKVENREKVLLDSRAKALVSSATMARTVVDEMIQELFLSRMYALCPKAFINAEENVPLNTLFSEQKHRNIKHRPIRFGALAMPLAAHIDPLDGTLNYVEGSRDFDIGMGISNSHHQFTHTVIYAPARNRLYTAWPSGTRIATLDKMPISEKPAKTLPIVYAKRALSPLGVRALQALGLTVNKGPNIHLAIVDTVCKKASAFLCSGSNPHDTLIPAAFAKARGITPINFAGKFINTKKLRVVRDGQFLRFERIPSIAYFSCERALKKEILLILRNPRHLFPEYLKYFRPHEQK